MTKERSNTKNQYHYQFIYRRRLNVLKDKELQKIDGYEKTANYVQVKCGCTSQKYGDSLGRLRLFTSGLFLINCECRKECQEGDLTPYEFVKHSGREGNRKWKSHIWLPIGEDKVPLAKSPILKYYKFAANRANARPKRNVFHRDEFINCHACNKPRRFSQRTEEERRNYHAATMSRRWSCSDWPYGEINCDEEAERESRRSLRGCPETPACEGCNRCVCFGCVLCRFNDCRCRICVDFVRNAGP